MSGSDPFPYRLLLVLQRRSMPGSEFNDKLAPVCSNQRSIKYSKDGVPVAPAPQVLSESSPSTEKREASRVLTFGVTANVYGYGDGCGAGTGPTRASGGRRFPPDAAAANHVKVDMDMGDGRWAPGVFRRT
jgi:hypothetical protein